MLPLFEQESTQLVFSDGELVDQFLQPIGTSLWKAVGVEQDYLQEQDWMTYFYRESFVTGAAMAFRRTLIDGMDSFPGAWLHDAFLSRKAAALGGLVPCSEKLFLYRQHGENFMGAHIPQKRDRIVRWIERSKNRKTTLEGRYQGYLDLYGALSNSLSENEDKRMKRFIAFVGDLYSSTGKNRLVQAYIIWKHYLNGDYTYYYDGMKGALRDIAATFVG